MEMSSLTLSLWFCQPNDLAVFLDEGSDGMLEQVEHRFRRPAQSCSLRRHHDRPVDQDRMIKHEADQFVVAPFGICLLYTSDAADDLLCVDLGGRRIIK